MGAGVAACSDELVTPLILALSGEKSVHYFISALKPLAAKGALEQGRLVHGHIIRCNLEANLFVLSSLIDLYDKCSNLADARSVFAGAPEHDVVSWSAMISAYAEHGHGQEALNLYENMKHRYLEPTKITFLCLLKACASIGSLHYGGVIHVHIVKQGIELDVYVGSSLVNMYAKCGSLDNARHVFDRLPKKNVVSWSSMIAGFVQDGFHDEALVFFRRMQANGIDPDDVTYVFILKSCGSAAALGQAALKIYRMCLTGYRPKMLCCGPLRSLLMLNMGKVT